MARKTQVLLVDDIDGTDATNTVTFGLDGVAYEIDLNDDNARQLRSELEKWTAPARRTGGRARRGTGGGTAGDAKKIRQWEIGRASCRERGHGGGGGRGQ